MNKIDKIKFVVRKYKQWYYQEENSEEKKHMISNIKDFLQVNTNFIQISGYDIINMCCVENSVLNGTSGFLIVSGTKINVTRRYISKVRHNFITFLNQKYGKEISLNKSSWLSKSVNSSEILNIINIENIKFLERKNIITIIYYVDGTQRSYYESLKYFEQIFINYPNMIRIRRNCIVNMKYAINFERNSATRTAKIEIESKTFDISRRCLPTFKRKQKVI